MLERVYDTIRAIIYHEMPKDKNDRALVFDRPITAWYFGDRAINNTNLSVTFKGGAGDLKDVGLGLQELSYTISIEVDAGADNAEISERLIQETVRLFLSIMRKHRRIWIVDICPICEKFVISPTHFINTHNDILLPYLDGVEQDYENLWYETHPSTIAPNELPSSAKATEAFLRLYEDVRNNTTIANLPSKAIKNIKRMQSDYVEPIRILYDVNCNSNKFSDDSINKALQKGGGLNISAKELIKQQFYGPDNVPTTALKYL